MSEKYYMHTYNELITTLAACNMSEFKLVDKNIKCEKYEFVNGRAIFHSSAQSKYMCFNLQYIHLIN